nr:Gag-Pol polyprotein [Tanacetum cinerariifolium]
MHVNHIFFWYLDSGCSKNITGDCSQLTNFIQKFLGQFCDSDLEVAFKKHTCFVRNLEGVDLISRSWETNIYTLSLGDMMASSLICLLSKALKTKSWLWHQRLLHLNFGAINHLVRHGIVRGLPKLKFEKYHFCSACAMGKSKKHSHKPKYEDTNQEKLYLIHMDLCEPMRFDEALDFIIKFLKMIHVRLNATVRKVCADNGTEFVNQTLCDYYESVGITYETSVARTLQQNSVVERRNRTLVEAARIMLIYAKALLFLWEEPLFDELFSIPVAVVSSVHADEILVPSIEAQAPGVTCDSPSSTTVDQDAPSLSSSQTTSQTQSQDIPLSTKEANHDLEVVHMSNDPHFGLHIPKTVSVESSSSVIIHKIVSPNTLISKHLTKWTKNPQLNIIIGDLS